MEFPCACCDFGCGTVSGCIAMSNYLTDALLISDIYG